MDPIILTHHRIAADGEKLVTHRFKSGAIRLVGRDGFERWLRSESRPRDHGRMAPIKKFINGCVMDFLTTFGFVDLNEPPSADEPGPVIEIPCDSLLLICDIPSRWQHQYRLRPCEEAFFSGHSSAGTPYGTLSFGNGVTVRTQLLDEAQSVRVIDNAWPEGVRFGR